MTRRPLTDLQMLASIVACALVVRANPNGGWKVSVSEEHAEWVPELLRTVHAENGYEVPDHWVQWFIYDACCSITRNQYEEAAEAEVKPDSDPQTLTRWLAENPGTRIALCNSEQFDNQTRADHQVLDLIQMGQRREKRSVFTSTFNCLVNVTRDRSVRFNREGDRNGE